VEGTGDGSGAEADRRRHLGDHRRAPLVYLRAAPRRPTTSTRSSSSSACGWLEGNGDAIYATGPWTPAATTTASGQQVRFTRRDGVVYAIVLADDVADGLTIRGLTLPAGSRIGVLHGAADLAWTQAANDVRIAPPPQPPSRHAQVLTITTA
jgi:hypothetical protein